MCPGIMPSTLSSSMISGAPFRSLSRPRSLLGSLPLSSFGGLSPSSRGGSTREADRHDHSAKGDFVRLRQAEMLLEELEIDQGPEQLFVVLPALFMFGEQLLDFMAIA